MPQHSSPFPDSSHHSCGETRLAILSALRTVEGCFQWPSNLSLSVALSRPLSAPPSAVSFLPGSSAQGQRLGRHAELGQASLTLRHRCGWPIPLRPSLLCRRRQQKSSNFLDRLEGGCRLQDELPPKAMGWRYRRRLTPEKC